MYALPLQPEQQAWDIQATFLWHLLTTQAHQVPNTNQKFKVSYMPCQWNAKDIPGQDGFNTFTVQCR